MENDVKVKLRTSAPVKHKGFEVIVKNKEGDLGTLLIGKGCLEWLPKGKSENKQSLSWSKFSEFMASHSQPMEASTES